jgi:hypothetical protein
MTNEIRKMKAPGFSAEASLYQTSERFQMARSPNVLTDGREVRPQFVCVYDSGVKCCSAGFGFVCSGHIGPPLM